MKVSSKNILIIIAILTIALIIFRTSIFGENNVNGISKSNGSIEATTIDVSTKLATRVNEILVNDGDFVQKGDILAYMQTDSLDAQLNEAKANYQLAINNKASAQAQVSSRVSDKVAAEAVVLQKESELFAAERKLNRIKELVDKGAISKQDYDDQLAITGSLKAAISTAEAQVMAAQSAIDAAKAQEIGAESQIDAAMATIDRIEADIKDSILVAPRDGRVQYRIAEPGEVLGAGGKVINLIDLSDVYMTFFIPAQEILNVQIGSEVRLVLDSNLNTPLVIPAKISFISSKAQFTPKNIETEDERQKMMFRAKAQISPDLLKEHLQQVKTGVRGVAWFKTNPNVKWPPHLDLTTSNDKNSDKVNK